MQYATSAGDDVGVTIGAFFRSIDNVLGLVFYTPMLYVGLLVGVVSFLFLKKNKNFALRMVAAFFLTGAVYVLLRALHIVRGNEFLNALALIVAVIGCLWFVGIAMSDAKRWQRIVGGILMVLLVLALVFLLGAFFPDWGLTDFMATVGELWRTIFSSAEQATTP